MARVRGNMKPKNDPRTLPYRDAKVKGFHLLIVEKEPSLYRLYVSPNGIMFCHYDSGQFENIDVALQEIVKNFDSTAFEIYPFTSFTRNEVLEKAPHASEELRRFAAFVARGEENDDRLRLKT